MYTCETDGGPRQADEGPGEVYLRDRRRTRSDRLGTRRVIPERQKKDQERQTRGQERQTEDQERQTKDQERYT